MSAELLKAAQQALLPESLDRQLGIAGRLLDRAFRQPAPAAALPASAAPTCSAWLAAIDEAWSLAWQGLERGRSWRRRADTNQGEGATHARSWPEGTPAAPLNGETTDRRTRSRGRSGLARSSGGGSGRLGGPSTVGR